MLIERYITTHLKHLPRELMGRIPDIAAVKQLAKLEKVVFTSSSLFSSPTKLEDIYTVQDQTMASRHKVIHVAASLALASNKPELMPLVKTADEHTIPCREMEVDMLPGGGVMGRLERTWYVLGEESIMLAEGIELGVASQALSGQLETSGKRVVFLAQKQPKRLLALFAFGNEVSPTLATTVTLLKSLGLEVLVLAEQKEKIARGQLQGLEATIYSSLGNEEKKAWVRSNASEQMALVVTPATYSVFGKSCFTIVLAEESGRMTSIEKIEDLPLLIRTAQNLLAKTRRRFFWSKL